MLSAANDRQAGPMLDKRHLLMSRLLAWCLTVAMILVLAQAAQAQGQPPAAPPAPIAGPAGLMTACPDMPVGLTAADLSGPAVLAPDGTREASPVVLGDDIALGLRHCAPDSQGLHDGWNYRVFVTNLAWDAAGNLSPIARNGPGGRELLLQRDSPLVLFNLVAVVEWDATPKYLADLGAAFRRASGYLFDLTDGQMALGQVTIVDNVRERYNPTSDRDAWWKSADIRIRPDNTINPKHIPAAASATRYGIELGPFWSHTGVDGNWSNTDGHRTLIHELGHYALGLYDEYGTNEFCTHEGSVPPDSTGDGTRASAMSWQFDATELSACPPHPSNCTTAWSALWPLWSEACARTRHYRETRQSAWAVIDQRYSDPATDPRWQIVSPTERGRVMAGPTAVPAAFPWPQILVHSYIDPICGHNEAGCLPVREVCVDNAQTTCGTAPKYVSLQRSGATDRIRLGTLNAEGCIRILEAKPGSKLVFRCFNRDNRDNHEAVMVIEESMPASVSATYPETPLALPATPSTAFAAALLNQDAAVLDWTTRYWENVQIVAQNYPDLALQLFGPPLELPADSESLISLLAQQASLQADWQGIAGPHLPVAGDVAFDTDWPAAGSLWWQQNPLDDAANAQQRILQQALPLVAQAYRRQTNIAVQTIDADSGGFLITPDGVWTAEAPRQPAPVDLALESISAVPGQQAAGDIATGFSLTASGSLVGPIMVRYTTNCGPDGGATDLALVNIQTNAQINPTFIESCFPVEFAIDEAGTYRLISTAQ